jgi:hypothetical protein
MFANPIASGLGCAACFTGNRFNCRPQGWILTTVISNHLNGAFAYFRGKLTRFAVHDSIFSKVRASIKAGAVHFAQSVALTG